MIPKQGCKASSKAGFSLIELMLVVVIIGILASIALPTFSRYISSAKRPEAVMFLNEVADAQELYYSLNTQFASTFKALDVSIEGAVQSSDTVIEGPQYSYELSQPDGITTWYCTASGNIDGDPWVDIISAGELTPR